jgi:hypothetical protein
MEYHQVYDINIIDVQEGKEKAKIAEKIFEEITLKIYKI